ncbi:MAG: tripartite tricarboxylate transporter TctB family protein [Streptosporangiales bacterium]|nr:tripartite tricarboxylate transporter TctB family protein [Streptosporangiales bacterium]
MHEQNQAAPPDRPSPPAGPGPTGPPGPAASSALAPLIGQAVLALVAAYVVFTSFGLGLWSHIGPGPGFFPLVLGVAMLLLALSWFVQERRRTATPAAAPAQGAATATEVPEVPVIPGIPSTPAAGTGDGSGGRGHVLAVVGSLIVLGLLIDLLGFQLTMFAFLLFHLKRQNAVRWITAVIISAVGSVGTFVLFGAGLGVQLPAAGIPFLANLGL